MTSNPGQKAHSPGEAQLWAVSPFNRTGTDASPMYRRPPRIVDCTLRDGEQQAGIAFSKNDKIELAKELAGLGVSELEIGTPAVSSEDREAAEAIVHAQLGVDVSALARARQDDIALVRDCGVPSVRISYPISERQRAAKTRIDDDEYIDSALTICSYARNQRLHVIFSPYDTTRCNLELLGRLLEAFRREGCVDRVRLVDTAGAASPQAITYLTEYMHRLGGIPIEVHCHNDFGLATANTIAGALAGGEFLSVTLGGLGERSGNAALEEVVLALRGLYGLEIPIQTERFVGVANEVARRSRIRLQPHKAVVGSNAFAHETGMVVAGVLQDPFTAEPYKPELVGQTRTIILGKKSGRSSIEYKLSEMGIHASEDQLLAVLDLVKNQAIAKGRALSEHEFQDITRLAGLLEVS
jgi:isopropylmalate/homocitrate/citramalate synthase